MDRSLRARNVVLVLAGVAGLLLKSRFRGSIGDLAYSYLGNLAVTFAVYFLVSIAAGPRLRPLAIAAIALTAVSAFELTDGFGVMTNVYDPFDYLANAGGVVLAWFVDVISVHISRAASQRRAREAR